MLDIFNILKDKSDITRKTYISKLNIIKKKYFPEQDDFEFIKKISKYDFLESNDEKIH